jgi:alkylhydroperoxidase/carboxymuconolactone decarboxylase family protein YurZ
MAPNPTAQKNHEQLFPGCVPTLAATDPELNEYFDNFAFDEVLRDGKLDARARLMAQLASLIACQALSEYRLMVGAALNVGVQPVEVKEIVYQAIPYVGLRGQRLAVLHTAGETRRSGTSFSSQPKAAGRRFGSWPSGLSTLGQGRDADKHYAIGRLSRQVRHDFSTQLMQNARA